MNRFSNLEHFIVDIEDSTTLLKLYLDRLRRAPSKAATYCEAICQHSEEIAQAVHLLKRELYTADGSLSQGVSFHLAASIESLSDLAELIQYSALRLATQQVTNPTEVTDSVTQATSCFEGVVRSLSNIEVPFDLSQVNRITHHLRTLLTVGSISAQANATSPLQGPSTLSPPPPQEAEVLFSAEDDPFDELALGEDFFDDVIGGLDNALDSALRGSEDAHSFDVHAMTTGELSEAAAAEMLTGSGHAFGHHEEYAIETPSDDLRDLFANIAAAYVQPVKEFIAELRRGKVSKEWLEICRPSVQSIARAAESMEYYELFRRLRSFDEFLAGAQQEPDNRAIKSNWQTKLMKAYADLEEFLPQTFQIPEDSESPEGIIINSLLKQVKGVGQGTIKKLFSIGMTSLDVYFVASPGDIAAAAGIKIWLAERICERFRQYQQQLQQLSEAGNQESKRLHEISECLEELKRQQFLFKRATLEDWYSQSDSSEKKRFRKDRQQVMWRLNVLLAELGQMELIQEIKNLVFEKRIERLQEFLDAQQFANRAAGEI